ncbi:MAG: MFS transporter [Gammaproteobacteria bacterium]
MTLKQNTQGIPYWRLSGFYFFYFAGLGAILPYWSLYLKSIDFNAMAIGQLTAILVGTKIIAPNIWGWIADHHGQRMRIIRFASLIAALSFTGVLFTTSFFWLALVLVVFGFFWNASLPQFEATTLTYLGDSFHAYTRIRVWGSVGFISAVLILGGVFAHYDIALLPSIILTIMFMIMLVTLTVPEQAVDHLPLEHNSLTGVLKQPEVIALLVVCFLMQASHAPYYTFYSIYLEEHGYSRTFIGEMWALGVIAEVAVFMFMHRLILHIRLKELLLISLIAAVIRWYMIGYFVDSKMLLIVAQLFHGATFGVYHATAIQLIHRYFTGRLQGRGQALYSSMSFGVGLSLGSLISGYVWESMGPLVTYQGAMLVSLLALFITWRWIKT